MPASRMTNNWSSHVQRALFALLPLLALPVLASAQKATFGVKGGLSYGNVSNSGALPGNVSHRTGFAIGLGAASGGVVGFGIEGLFAEHGVTSALPGDARKLDYVDVPVYLRLALPVQSFTPFAYAGPQASYELKCSAGGSDCASNGRPKFTYSGVVGAGLRIASLAGMTMEGRYTYGLKDLKLNTISDTKSYQTRTFMLLVGFSL